MDDKVWWVNSERGSEGLPRFKNEGMPSEEGAMNSPDR